MAGRQIKATTRISSVYNEEEEPSCSREGLRCDTERGRDKQGRLIFRQCRETDIEKGEIKEKTGGDKQRV